MCTNVVNKTSISETVIMEIKCNKLRRKSYAREFKLTAVALFHENGKQKLNTKAPGRGQKARFPEAERQLHNKLLKMRSEGKAVKRWWFLA